MSADTEGWAALDRAGVDAAKQAREAREEQWRLDSLHAAVFNTAQGREVLAHLRERTIEQPCWVPGQDASYGWSREGQNSVVREIEQRLARARRGPPEEIE